MKFFKNISDECLLGVLALIISIWVYFLNTSYLLLSGICAFAGICLLIVDNVNKRKNGASNIEKAKKADKK